MTIKNKLIVLSFLQYAVWGTYLTTLGNFLGSVGLGEYVGIFYSVQGFVSIFMPPILGIVADRFISAQKVLGYSHYVSSFFMLLAGFHVWMSPHDVSFPLFFTLYTIGVAFYMPTLSLSNSVAFNILQQNNMDTIEEFPGIRVFGTIGFIIAMGLVDIFGIQSSVSQFTLSALFGITIGTYSLFLPDCPVTKANENVTMKDKMGISMLKEFKEKNILLFFIFSIFLGISLQVTNGFANPFISSYLSIPKYANTFGVLHSNLLISISQMSEALCILMIPLFLKKHGIKKVLIISMIAWIFRFVFFGIGNPGTGVWFFILSMVIYGVAFDFSNIAGSIFVDSEIAPERRNSAQGFYTLMFNGLGATIGTLVAQLVVNRYCNWESVIVKGTENFLLVGEWNKVWLVFSIYSFLVLIAFTVLYKYKHVEKVQPKLPYPENIEDFTRFM